MGFRRNPKPLTLKVVGLVYDVEQLEIKGTGTLGFLWGLYGMLWNYSTKHLGTLLRVNP